MKKSLKALLVIIVGIVAVFSACMLSSCQKFNDENNQKNAMVAVEKFKFGEGSATKDYHKIFVHAEVGATIYKIPNCTIPSDASFKLYIGDSKADEPQIIGVGEVIDMAQDSTKRLTAVISYKDIDTDIEIYVTNKASDHNVKMVIAYGASVFNTDGRAFVEEEMSVIDREHFCFIVGKRSDYKDKTVTVTLDGAEVVAVKGVYTIEEVTKDIVIYVGIA